MENEINVKNIPGGIVYYRDGIIENFSKITEFILEAGSECSNANPGLKCTTPEYCYISYFDKEYKDKDIRIRYAQAVEAKGNETENIKFMEIEPIKAVCIYHKGSYSKMMESYKKVLEYVQINDYKIVENIRESYIDGCWNKENEEDYLTEIQVPIQ